MSDAATRQRILVVEDEPSICDNIVYSLESEGFDTLSCPTGASALAAVAADRFHLAILDVGLPDTTGFEVCKQIRARGSMPVIFLTARASEIDRVVGLEIGGDDYMVKPFSPRELTARVRAVLRRCASAPAEASAAGASPRFVVDDERAEIRYCGAALSLSRIEFRMLKVFAGHPGRVFSRAQLMDHAWEEPEASLERTVDTHIKSLRAKLKAVRPDTDPIRTHRGMGYSLATAEDAAP